MNLTIARVLTCTESGCHVQPIDSGESIKTNYSEKVVEHNIPIRPKQFVIVDREASPPETVFRFKRAIVTKVDGDQIEVDDEGAKLLARRSSALQDDLAPGIEVVLMGQTDENRRVIDVVVDGKPAHADEIEAEWFPQMEKFR